MSVSLAELLLLGLMATSGIAVAAAVLTASLVTCRKKNRKER